MIEGCFSEQQRASQIFTDVCRGHCHPAFCEWVNAQLSPDWKVEDWSIASATLPRPFIDLGDGRVFRGRWPQSLGEKGEAPYIRELAAKVAGVPEVTLQAGRADVMNRTDVFEVEHAKTWRTGARQAFSYAGMTGLAPNLALFGRNDYLDIYIEVRDRMPDLRLWVWHIGPSIALGKAGWWKPVTSRKAARAYQP